MKILVIYYSLTGNTKFIAETIASEVQADLLEIKPKQDIADKGVMKYFWGGKQVFTKERPELVIPFAKDPKDYDLIFIGTPVWGWHFAPAFNSYFSQVKIEGKKIAVFLCHGGGAGKTVESFKTALPGNELIWDIDFKEPLKHNKEKAISDAKTWAKAITKLV